MIGFMRCIPTILLFLAAGAWAENLLVNPGFEGQVGPDGVPEGWALAWEHTHSNDPAKTIKQRPDFALDEAVRHSGRRSVRMGVRRAQDDALLRQVVKNLPPGKKFYRLKAWIKTDNITGGDARLTVAFYSSQNKWVSANYNLIRVDKTQDWTLHVALFEAPDGAADMRVGLWLNFNYTGGATAWFDDLSLEPTDLKEIPPTHYVDGTPVPPLTREEQTRGYVAFWTNYLDMIFHETVPTRDAISAKLSAFASPGEYEPITFAVRALKDMEEIKLTSEDLIGPNGSRITSHVVDARPVRFLVKKPHYSIMEWMLVPAFLEKRESVSIPAHTTQPFWITIRTPADAAQGIYKGQLRIEPKNAEAMSLPIEFEVLPIKLEEPKGVAFGMYDNDKWYGDDPDGLYKKYVDMREHGMNSVGFCGGIGGKVAFENGKAKIEWDDTKGLGLGMKCYMRAGFTEPFHWLMSVTGLAMKQGPLDSPQFETAYRSIIEAVLERARKEHWPEIIWQPEDEAFEHRPRWPHMMRTLPILKKLGLRTEADGMNGNPEGLEEVIPLLDVLNYHDGPHLKRTVYDGPAWEQFVDRLEREGKSIWFYNIDTTGYHPEIMRFGYGFHLIRCRAKGSYCWAYQWGGKDPYVDPPKQQGFNFMFNYPAVGNETGGPSPGWEGTREGVDDYRYYVTYLKAAEAARASGDQKKLKIVTETDRALKEALAKIEYDTWKQPGHQGLWTGGERADENGVKTCSGHYKLPNGWTFDDYNRLRRILADAIVELQK
jgi:hypothetical protein